MTHNMPLHATEQKLELEIFKSYCKITVFHIFLYIMKIMKTSYFEITFDRIKILSSS